MGIPVLQASGVSKRFGPIQALCGVDFHVDLGEVHALLGINGAGKSTLIKILSGIIQKSEGSVSVAGNEVLFRGPDDAIAAGIATVQQHPELVPDMTGLDNIFLGRETVGRGLFSKVDRQSLVRRAEALLKRFAVPLDLNQLVVQMSAVERESVAILQAIASDDIKILILDEPTSTLTDVEREDLFELMRQLREQGISIIYITHQLEEVFAIADSFSVFRNGACVARMSVEEAKAQDKSLATLMLGEDMGDVFPTRSKRALGELVLSLSGYSCTGVFDSINLEVSKGEVFGIFGLVGSGSEEIAKAIFGVLSGVQGETSMKGRPLHARSPREALDAGIFLVPGDRRVEGLALNYSSIFNVPLANLKRACKGRWILRRSEIQEDTRALTESVDLYPSNLDTPASGFSGGNQQKIVLAKGLYSKADLYIFVNPTVGVDIGARAKIYALIHQLAERAAVILISNDCDEVHGVSDRCIGLYKGRQVNPLQDEFSRDGLLMAGIMGVAQ